jgi:hypothetical protein
VLRNGSREISFYFFGRRVCIGIVYMHLAAERISPILVIFGCLQLNVKRMNARRGRNVPGTYFNRFCYLIVILFRERNNFILKVFCIAGYFVRVWLQFLVPQSVYRTRRGRLSLSHPGTVQYNTLPASQSLR